MHIDSLLHPRWIVPIAPDAGRILERHSLAVQDGRILEIAPSELARAKYTAEHSHELPGHALIPGLVNAHTHAAMSLLRGLADDLPLMTWLNEHIWPAEGRWISDEFIADGTRLAVAEMLRSGTTCFNDMYFFPDVVGRVSAAAGIRAVVGLIMIDFPSAWAADPDEYLRRGLEVHDEFRNDSLITTAFAPHAPYTVSNQPLARVRTLADELEIPVHMHVHETRDEIKQSLATFGCRPLQRLDDLGLLTPDLVAVHMTQLEPEEIGRVAAAGASVVHCPESNLKLASGFCPVAALVAQGANVALGTDGAASNNDLDMLGELRTAGLLAKGVARDASALPAAETLKMATLNGAIALGLGAETGSLEAGKAADLVAIDLGGLESQPVYNPISQIVYASDRHQVSDVWVAGRQVLRERNLTTLDCRAIQTRVTEWQARIAGHTPS